MLRSWMVAGLMALVACSSDQPAGPATPTGLALVTQPAPAPQSGVALSPQPIVELRDARGNAVASKGVLVSVSLTGGGTLTGQADLRTDASGRAAFTDLAIVGTVGARTLRFTSGSLTPALSDPITLAAGTANSAAPSAGNNQTAAAGTDLAVAPAVLVTDGAGNPVAGLAVVFGVTVGGGSVQGGNVQTSANGIASASKWTLGTRVGTNTLTATVTGGIGVTFTATGVVGPPAKLVAVSRIAQTAVAAAPVDSIPAVRILDAFDNPIAGVTVTFAVTGGGGKITTPSPVSDATGLARVGAWTLGYVGGANAIIASRAGITPVTFTATGLDYQVAALEVSDETNCALTTAGIASCWGLNDTGQVGDGGTVDDSLPTRVSGGIVFASISPGSASTCGLTATGEAYCWGDNTFGQIGDGTQVPSLVPVRVTGGLAFKSIDAGQGHVCALTTAGAAYCWGLNANGRLGDNTTVDKPVPTAVLGGHVFTTISAGNGHTCGLRNDGAALCWGQGNGGRIGDGATVDRRVPTLVTGSLSFASVSAGGGHSCGLATSGAAYCWGQGNNGVLGNGATASLSVPTAVGGGLVFSTLIAGIVDTCGIVGPDAYCWGSNGFGQVGDGTRVIRTSPVKLNGQGLALVSVVPGSEHTCVRSVGGAAYCLGNNDVGMLGIGSLISSLILLAVHP